MPRQSRPWRAAGRGQAPPLRERRNNQPNAKHFHTNTKKMFAKNTEVTQEESTLWGAQHFERWRVVGLQLQAAAKQAFNLLALGTL